MRASFSTLRASASLDNSLGRRGLASMALNHHPLNHLSDIVQIHESYQIQWESRLDDAAALRRIIL